MALIYNIDKFETVGSDKLVGFLVDSNGSKFIIDKTVAIVAGKTNESYITDAQALAQAEIDAWVIDEDARVAAVGKVWNSDTNTLE